jgi:5'-deoxynucleotidase YfbR-like HD superfamily hydrolase
MVQDADDRGHFIGTASGLPFWPLDPRPEDIRVLDIAIHLSRICRFGGALDPSVPGIYSVAQHSVLVSYRCPPEHALEGLLHDAAEAYIGDQVKPLKMMMEDYQGFERLIERAVRKRFSLPKKMTPAVKEADRRIFATEVRDLVPEWRSDAPWQAMPDPYEERIEPWTCSRARDMFLQRFEELSNV